MTTITAEERAFIRGKSLNQISAGDVLRLCDALDAAEQRAEKAESDTDKWEADYYRLMGEMDRCKSEIAALNELVEALAQKCNSLRYPAPADVAGHLEIAAATQAVDAARSRLEEVRNA